MSTWKDKVSFIAPTAVAHDVGGQSVNFYAISTRMLFRLKTVSRPLAQALAVLFSDTSRDSGRVMRDFRLPVEEGEEGEGLETGSETILEAAPVESLKFRRGQQEQAIDRLVDAFSEDSNRRLIGAIIFDSCRDMFPRDAEDKEHDEFLELLDLTTLAQFLLGVMKANAQVFGPLGETVSAAFKKHLKLEETESEGDDPDGGEIPDPSTKSTAPTLSPTPPAANPMAPTPVPAMPAPTPGS